MFRLLANRLAKPGLRLALPIARGSKVTASSSIAARAAAIATSAGAKPSVASSTPPRKKPTPLSAFFDPVSSATQRKRVESWSGGTNTFSALLALILVRSLAIPDSACAAITQATAVAVDQPGSSPASMSRAAICSPVPPHRVTCSPSRAPIQPPTRLVTTPKNS